MWSVYLVPLVIASCLQSSGEEGWHGQIRRSGCALADVHVCGDGTVWQAADVESGGDERAGAGRSGTEPSWGASSVPRGRDAERVAARDPVAPRCGDCGDGAGAEPGAKGRSAGCVGASGRSADGTDTDAVYKAPKQLAGLRSAASAYRLATQDSVLAKNRLKAVLLRSRRIVADKCACGTTVSTFIGSSTRKPTSVQTVLTLSS